MVIIPTEKRFDWKHAPTVLFGIVLLNVLVFFLYQSGDANKIDESVGNYETLGFFKHEWPLYQDYLKKHQQAEKFEDYRRMLEDHEDYTVSYYLLTDTDFYRYLELHKHEMTGLSDIDEWNSRRLKIHQTLQSVSYISLGLTPKALSPITLVTHMFLHGDVMHLLGNLFFLVICGFAVEAAVGHLRFLVFYLVSGIAGGLLHAFIDLQTNVSLVGASGAISGVMAMYLGVFRLKKIEFFYWLFIFVGYFRAPALIILPIYVGKEVFSFYSDPDSGVAFMAHTGGFIAGVTLILVALAFNRDMLNQEYIENDTEIDPKQKALAKVYQHIEYYRFQHAHKALLPIIKQYGLNFDLALLRYQILNLNKPQGFINAVVSLFKMKKLSPVQLEKLAKIWQDNKPLQQKLGGDELFDLCWQFAGLKDPSLAEDLFSKLQIVSNDRPALENLARKISISFESTGQQAKSRKYAALAE